MSKSIPLIIAYALVCHASAQSAAAHFRKGQAAEQAGDPIAAKEHYARALKLDPKNPDARFSLGQLKLHSASIAAKGREAKFGAVIVPVFQLDEASLPEALEALSSVIGKLSKEKIIPNFIIEDPKNLLATRKISMNLKNLPAKAIMKYLMDQTRAKARFDEHAVVVIVR